MYRALSFDRPRQVYRRAVSGLFFLQGLCFATWASRIPSIQQELRLSDTTLGLVLFALPAGSLLSLPFAGWLVTRLGSHRVAMAALGTYALLLSCLGLASSLPALIAGLTAFGIAGNTSNIAINTQAVGVELRYGRSIMAAFHGLWSLAGFAAAGIGTFMMGKAVAPLPHFMIMTSLILLSLLACVPFLLPETRSNSTSTPLFVRPDRPLLLLGLIAFCCMICEGAMFDWSGIYFQKVVGAQAGWVGAGYTAFMLTMAAGRFVADRVAANLGIKRTLQLSGTLIASGIGLSILLPSLLPSIIGFLIVGFGVSAVVPLVYSAAGRSSTLSTGMALAAVSSIGFFGFLFGPPILGLLAGAYSLRVAFVVVVVMGLAVAFLSGRSFPDKAGAYLLEKN